MKTAKKIISIALCCILVFSCVSFVSFAEEQISVKIRVEGIKENLVFRTISVPKGSSALDVLYAAIKKNPTVKVTVEDFETGKFITKINDEEYGQFGGTDGWFYTVNYVDRKETIDKYVAQNNDNIVIYYGDPITEGFAYPQFNLARLKDDGIVKLMGYSKEIDENGIPTYKTKPITSCSVTWRCGSETTKYFTDAAGEFYVPQNSRTSSYYVVQVEKTTVRGLPLVLRMEPRQMISADGIKSESQFGNIYSKIMSIIRSILRVFVSIFEGKADLGGIHG